MQAELVERQTERRTDDAGQRQGAPGSGAFSQLLNSSPAVQTQMRLGAELNRRGAVIQQVREQRSTETDEEYGSKVRQFETFEGKGKALWDSVNAATAEVNKDEAYNARYETVSQTGVQAAASPAVTNRWGFRKSETKARGAKKMAYTSMIKDGTLLATYNYAKEDVLPTDSAEGDAQTKRENHSEIMFQHLKEAEKVAALNTVVRVSIENATTMQILEMCFTRASDRRDRKTFTREDPEFFALLATDNCKGVAFMLKDHPVSFANKTITSIETVGSAALVLHIGNR